MNTDRGPGAREFFDGAIASPNTTTESYSLSTINVTSDGCSFNDNVNRQTVFQITSPEVRVLTIKEGINVQPDRNIADHPRYREMALEYRIPVRLQWDEDE